MADDRSMETPQISRSGRVLKKSAKVKEMEDFDINEFDVQGKARKKSKTMEDFDEYDDKRVAPIKIPKISFNVQGTKKKMNEGSSSVGKQVFKPSFQNTAKAKQDARRAIYHDSSDGSKESDSSSVSSESSSSSPTSSDASDDDDPYSAEYQKKVSLSACLPGLSHSQDTTALEQDLQRFESPVYMEPSSDMSSDDSEDAGSDTALVIAEDSDESANYTPRGQRGNAKKRGGKKDPTYAPRQGGGRKKPPAKAIETVAAKKKKPAPKAKPLSAYMLWCSENRKRIAASSGNIGFGNIGKKMGEAWQALPEKEKMAWRRKAKRLAMKNTGNVINTGASNTSPNKAAGRSVNITDELLKGLTDNTGILATAPIDAAAHMKLLGDSLTVIGQRLIEHEGQLAVSGIYSVLLDTLLCAIGPLLCLTTEITGLEHLNTHIMKKTLDHIAYFMPGL